MNPSLLLKRVLETSAFNQADAKAQFAQQCKRGTTFRAANNELNPRGLVIQSCPSGDPGFYHEMAVSVYDAKGRCLADLNIGLSDTGEVRIFATAEGQGDGDHLITIYPERARAGAVEVDHR